MFFYTAYGLKFKSDLQLPELAAGEGPTDAAIHLGNLDSLDSKAARIGDWVQETPDRSFLITPSETCLSWENVGRLTIRGGSEILVQPAPGAEEAVVRLFILGQGMPVLLHQREFLVLHASSVALNGTAVGFLGSMRSGKSTLAAALYAQGHRMMADDVLCVDINGASRPSVFPSFPQFKLWPDSEGPLLGDPESLARVHPQFEKRALRTADRFSPGSLPLSGIYVLARGQSTGIESLRPQEAFVELVRHSATARYGPQLIQASGVSSHFAQCAEVLKTTPIYRLTRCPSRELLPATVRMLEDHLTVGVPHEAAPHSSSATAVVARESNLGESVGGALQFERELSGT